MATILGYDYQTTTDDCTVYGLSECFGVPDVDIYTYKQTCYIDWLLEPESRSWGMKSISVHVTKVVASIEWEVYTDDLSEFEIEKLVAVDGMECRNKTVTGLIEINSCEEWNGRSWIIKSEFNIDKDGMCRPQFIEIDFETMIIRVC